MTVGAYLPPFFSIKYENRLNGAVTVYTYPGSVAPQQLSEISWPTPLPPHIPFYIHAVISREMTENHPVTVCSEVYHLKTHTGCSAWQCVVPHGYKRTDTACGSEQVQEKGPDTPLCHLLCHALSPKSGVSHCLSVSEWSLQLSYSASWILVVRGNKDKEAQKWCLNRRNRNMSTIFFMLFVALLRLSDLSSFPRVQYGFLRLCGLHECTPHGTDPGPWHWHHSSPHPVPCSTLLTTDILSLWPKTVNTSGMDHTHF